MSALLPNLLHFGRLLYQLGLDVPAGRMREVAASLNYINIGQRDEFYHTLRTFLVHRSQDLPIFDDAFRIFWRPPHGDWTETEPPTIGETRRSRNSEDESERSAADNGKQSRHSRTVQVEQMATLSYSQREGFWAKDFEQFSEEEVALAQQMMAAFEWQLGDRESKRWTPGSGPVLDLQRAIRHNMRYGGELLHLPSKRRKTQQRPLILLCDVSGSMERYSRMLLHFIHALTDGGQTGRVESFVFATRLTRITHQLLNRSVDDVVPTLPRTISDFGGGTQIGNALRMFNTEWARRVRGRGPVVLLISDGWDRGTPEHLRQEIARLQRSCHRLVWLNPLLGSPDYVPLTRGMQAALPWVDDFLPVHNMASLEELAQHLNQLPRHRSNHTSAVQSA